MPIRVTCPSCGKTINAGDQWAGKQATCPACKSPIQIPNPSPPAARLERGHIADAPSVNVHLPKRSSSLGIVSLILGVVGFLLCWIPLIGILTIPLSAMGVLLGGIGLVVALIRQGSGIGWPIAGLATCALALFIGGSQIAVIGAAMDAVNEAGTRDMRTNQQTTGPTYSGQRDIIEQPGEPADAMNDSGQEPIAEPSQVIDTRLADAEASNEWASAAHPVRQGDVEVRIVRTAQENTPLKDIFNDSSQSAGEQFSIQLEVQNLSSSKKLNYRTWQGSDFSFDRDYATLDDNFGNSYKRIDFGATTKIVGQVESDSIYPGKSITDLLVFEPPIDSADYLDLELPARNFGGEGMLRIRIPQEMFRGPDPAELAAQSEREAAEQAVREAAEARIAELEEARFRIWTATSGHTTEAKLIRHANEQVVLENRHGKQTKVPVSKLSEADQEYVLKWREDPQQQLDRMAFIDKAIKGKWFLKVELIDSIPNVWVKPVFHSLHRHGKTRYIQNVFANYYPEAWALGSGTGSEMVVVRSATNDTEIGSYTLANGLQLE